MKFPAPLAGIALAALLFGCGEDDAPATRPTTTATSTPPAVAEHSPTPVPTCQPLYPDVGFPVMVGRAGNAACVIWKGPSDASAQVMVQDGSFGLNDPPAFELLYPAPGGSPFTFPADALPPFRGNDLCFDSDTGFTVRVEGPGGALIGAEAWSTCAHYPILPSGCSGPSGPQGINANWLPAPVGRGPRPACITWEDRSTNETGFRIELGFPNSGEKFTYTAPPNTVEFIPPAADVEGAGDPKAGLGRKDFDIQVWALTPDGERLMGSAAVQVG